MMSELIVEIPPRPAKMYTYDINGVLEVNVHVPTTGVKKQLVIINKEIGLTEEIKKKLKEFQKLKMNPIQEEENQYVFSWGQRLYMQCDGEIKQEIERKLQYFVHVMENNPYQVVKVRKYLSVYFAYLEKLVENYIGWDSSKIEEGSWYEDEEEREIDNLFKVWDEEER